MVEKQNSSHKDQSERTGGRTMVEKQNNAIKIIWILQIIFLLLGIVGVLLLGLEIFAGHMDPDKLTAYASIAFGIVMSGFLGLIRFLLTMKRDKMQEK